MRHFQNLKIFVDGENVENDLQLIEKNVAYPQIFLGKRGFNNSTAPSAFFFFFCIHGVCNGWVITPWFMWLIYSFK